MSTAIQVGIAPGPDGEQWWSDPQGLRTAVPGVPPVTDLVAAYRTNEAVEFTWRHPGGADEYHLEVMYEYTEFDGSNSTKIEVPWTLVGKYGPDVRHCRVGGLGPGDGSVVKLQARMTAVTLEESTPPPIDPNPIPPPTGGDWIDKSGTIGTETWSGNIRIVGDITLSSGATVTVGQGSSVVWAGAYRLSVGSGRSLIFNGTEEFPIVWEGWGGGHIDIRSTGGYVEKHWVRSSGSRLDSTSQTGVVPAAVIEDCLLTDFTLETFYRGVEVRRSYVGKSPGATKTFSCAPGSVFEDNILRAGKFGGSAWDGTILRNVFIAEDIDPGDSINDTGTHELMFGIKSDAVIRNNLFIGPALAHTMTIGASSGSDITFEHNTFDGRSGNHAYLNHLPNDPVQRLRFKHNLFANVGTAVHDELTTTNCVTYTDWNAFLNVNDHYKGIVMSDKLEFDPGFGANDLDVTASIFTDPQFGYPFPYSHSDMISGETTHAEMYQAYIAAYTPKEGSDVIGAGDPADGSPTLGAIAA